MNNPVFTARPWSIDTMIADAKMLAATLHRSELESDKDLRKHLLAKDFKHALDSLKEKYPDMSDAGAALTAVCIRKSLRKLSEARS